MDEEFLENMLVVPDADLNRITSLIIGAAIEVHRILGPGFLEVVYQKALEIALKLSGISFVPQHRVALNYKGEPVGEGFLDFLVEGKVIVELKSVEALGAIHTAQVISYLRATHHKLGLLINFNIAVLKDGIKRVAL